MKPPQINQKTLWRWTGPRCKRELGLWPWTGLSVLAKSNTKKDIFRTDSLKARVFFEPGVELETDLKIYGTTKKIAGFPRICVAAPN